MARPSGVALRRLSKGASLRVFSTRDRHWSAVAAGKGLVIWGAGFVIARQMVRELQQGMG